jgi:ribonuclease R
MKKAVYQPDNIGHFGLAFTHYLHFTSPIRRYPDLLVHRLLKHLKNGRYPIRLAQKLDAILTHAGKHSSDMERRAMEAEREAVKAKQVQFMAQKVGDEYDGIITGVVNFGFFVRLIGPECEGLVRASTMDDDYYRFEENSYRLIGRRRGRIFRLGDKVRVGVLKVDVEAREIDLYVVAAAPETRKRPKKAGRRRSKP